MKTLKIALAAALLAAVSGASAAPVFECTDKNGGRVYTQQPGNNCRKADIGRAGVYSSVPPASAGRVVSEAYAGEGAPADGPAVNGDVRAARQQLAEAEKALEEGKKVRYGNERNYVRYQERIAGLEKAVEEARRKLEDTAVSH